MRRFAVPALVMLVVASCSEHFPRELDELALPSPASDAGVGPADATTSADGSSADANVSEDAGADASVISDAATDAETSTPPIVDGGNCNPQVAAVTLDARCDATTRSCPHVQQTTTVTYTTNPPANGPHYPVWANFQEFSGAVPDGNIVHSLEHGGVALFYSCNSADPACAKVVAELRAVRDAITTDPICDSSIRVRVIIAPRPANDTVIAAAAFGGTYRADCVDAASLTKFVTDHYAKAPEDLCFAGQTSF